MWRLIVRENREIQIQVTLGGPLERDHQIRQA